MFLLRTNLVSTIISLVIEDHDSVNFKDWSQFPGQDHQFWVLVLRYSRSRLCFPHLWCSEILRNRTQWERDVDAIHMLGMPKWHLRLSSDFNALQRLELRPGAEITARLLLFEFTHPFSFCPVIGSVSVGFLLPFLLVIEYYQGRDYSWKHGLCENTNFSKHCVSGPG